MKLATRRDGTRDGQLCVVSSCLSRYVAVPQLCKTLQEALDNWSDLCQDMHRVAALLADPDEGEAFDSAAFMAPLPRAYQWADGSAYVNHVELVRRARGVAMPESFWTEPLMYQGVSDQFLAAQDAIRGDPAWGLDIEGELAVITDDVPLGVDVQTAQTHIRLLMLVNDISLRHLIPDELKKGFGFFQSKPPCACAPVVVTPDELGSAWRQGRVHLPLQVWLNGKRIGAPEAGEDMVFNFPRLIVHAAKTRRLGAGTVIGSGTVSNKEASRGVACLAEQRMREIIEQGQAMTPFLQDGDEVRLEMFDAAGHSVFGAIEQRVEVAE